MEHEAHPTTPANEGFWSSSFGRFLRWLAYIPIGFTLTAIIETLTLLALGWLFTGELSRGTKTTVVLVIFPLGVLWIGGLYFGSLHLANRVICPNPRVGVVVFGTLYFLGLLMQIAKTVTMGKDGGIILLGLTAQVIFAAIATFSFISTHGSKD